MDAYNRAAMDSLRAMADAMRQEAREKAARPAEPAKTSNRGRQNMTDPSDTLENPPWLPNIEEGEEFDPRNPQHNPPDFSWISHPRTEPTKPTAVAKTAASSRPTRQAAVKSTAAPRPVQRMTVTAPPGEATTTGPSAGQNNSKRTPVPRATAAAQTVPINTARPHSVATPDGLLAVQTKTRGKRGGARPGAGRKPKSQASRPPSPSHSLAPEALVDLVTAGPTAVTTTSASIARPAKKRLPGIVVKNAPSQLLRQQLSNAGPSANIGPQQTLSQAPVGSTTPNPNSSAPPVITTAWGDPNTYRTLGRFFTKVLYLKPYARVMAGSPWTEEEEFVIWYLKDKGMKYTQIAPCVFPHTVGGCQNHWKDIKANIADLNEEQRAVVERQRAHIGQLFEDGAFNHKAESAARAADTRRHNPEVEGEGSGLGQAKAKGKRKAEEISEGDEVLEENDDEGEREVKAAKKA